MIAAARRRTADESGITIVEVLVAAMCLALVAGAAATLFITGADSSLASQRQAALISVADQQIQQVRLGVKKNGFAALAMNAAPAAGTNATLPYAGTTHTDPNDFVVSCGSTLGYLIEANYDNTAEGAPPGVAPWTGCPATSTQVAEPLVVQAGGIVTPKLTGVPVGGDTATVYEYVTDTYLGCSSSLGNCASATGDARRVVVAVVPNNHGRYDAGQNAPAYISTIFTNPVPSNQAGGSIGLTLGAKLG